MMQWIDRYAAPLLVLLLMAAAGGFFAHERWRLPLHGVRVPQSGRAVRSLWGIAAVAAIGLGWMAWNMGHAGAGLCTVCMDWRWLDGQAQAWIQTQAGAAWMPLMKLWTQLGHLGWMIVMGVMASVWLLYRRAWLQAGVWVVGVAGVGLCVRWIKNSVARERPEVHWVVEQGYSFPSGHSAGTVVCYGLLAWLLLTGYPQMPRWPVVLLTTVLVLGVGASRVLLGAHYVSDVLAGWMLGVAGLALVVGGAGLARSVAERRRASSDLV